MPGMAPRRRAADPSTLYPPTSLTSSCPICSAIPPPSVSSYLLLQYLACRRQVQVVRRHGGPRHRLGLGGGGHLQGGVLVQGGSLRLVRMGSTWRVGCKAESVVH